MPCFYPINCHRGPKGADGKRQIIWKAKEAPKHGFSAFQLACGRCIGCRLEYSRQWAVRCVHEAQMHPENSFVSLTYNDENLPENGSLKREDFRLFLKRLRKVFFGRKIRYFAAGEYGDVTGRPHYHAILFNVAFHDQKLWRNTERGFNSYRSPTLDRLWGKGHAEIGQVCFETAAYVARYVLKKIGGERAKEHYGGRLPEFAAMSTHPGIGRTWFEKYKSDVFPRDFVISRGLKVTPPKYYMRILASESPDVADSIKSGRLVGRAMVPTTMPSGNVKMMDDNDSVRLGVKEVCKKAKLSLLRRDAI